MCQYMRCGVLLPLAATFLQEGFTDHHILPPPGRSLWLWHITVLCCRSSCRILNPLFILAMAWVYATMPQSLKILGQRNAKCGSIGGLDAWICG